MLSIPDHVHMTAGPGGGSVLLDRRTGRCYAMNGIAGQLWQAWHDTGDYDAALAVVADHNPVGQRFPAQSRALADALLAKGLLVAQVSPPAARERVAGVSPRWGSGPEVGAGEPGAGEPDVATPDFRLAAAVAVPLTFALVLLPFRVTVWLLTWSRRRWCVQSAGTRQTEAALAAIRGATRYHPGRVACLEVSLGTVLTLALRRRHAELVIGVAHAPCRFHAWVGSPDGPAAGQGWTPDFLPIITL